MAEIPRMDLTTAGLKLYGKIQTGKATLNISKVVIGTGFLSGNETILDLDALKNEIDITTQILKNEIVGNGLTKLSFRITAAGEDFPLREVGVKAIDPDDGEILYCACNFGKDAEYVMVYGGMLPVTQEADIYFAIGTGNIKVEFSRETAAVSYKDFDEHTNNKENPHEVTAEQVFPDNANVLKNITANNITNFKEAVNAKHTHENSGVLAGITAALVTAWNSAVSHITNKANPHNVTKTQVGLGNVTNESKKTMFTSPEFTGTPTAPTAAANTSSTQIATTAFVQGLISNLQKQVTEIGQNAVGKIYVRYLMSNQRYDIVSDLDDDKYLITYSERAAGTIDLGIHEVAAGAKLPKATSSKVYLGCFTDSLESIIDDEVTSTQFLLYPNDTVYYRSAITWYYMDGVIRNPKYGEWEETTWGLYYFESHLS